MAKLKGAFDDKNGADLALWCLVQQNIDDLEGTTSTKIQFSRSDPPPSDLKIQGGYKYEQFM